MSEFKSIKTSIETRLKAKGSLFIAKAEPVKNISEADEFLKSVKKEFYDATHHCSAYKIYPDEVKYSDDGEPSGTAGIRILNAIDHFELFNIIVVVIRYFGGTKLGVGPLGKAYYQSAYSALENSSTKIIKEYVIGKVIYNYDETSLAHKILNDFNAVIIQNSFDEKPVIEFYLESEKADEMRKEFNFFNPQKIWLEISDKFVYL